MTGTKSGYTFTLGGATGNPVVTYTVTASPINASSGTRGFFSNESGVIRYNVSGVATVASSVTALQRFRAPADTLFQAHR